MIFHDQLIQLSISLAPHEHCKDYKEILMEKLITQYEKKAFEKFGIIDKILEIEEILYEEMMRIVPTVHFLLQTRVKTYFPSQGDVLTLKISKILPCGIYLQENCFRALLSIPIGFDLQKVDKDLQFYHPKRKISLGVGDDVTFSIDSIRFEKSSFHCLGNVL